MLEEKRITMDAQVTQILRGMGTEGAIITTLMGVITVLCAVIASMYVRANKIYGYRLKERDVLNTALASSTEATKEHTRSMESRSAAIAALADAVKDQSASFEHLRDRVMMQYEFMSREFDRHTQVVEAMAEANRSMAVTLAENKRIIETVFNVTEELRSKITRQSRISRPKK